MFLESQRQSPPPLFLRLVPDTGKRPEPATKRSFPAFWQVS